MLLRTILEASPRWRYANGKPIVGSPRLEIAWISPEEDWELAGQVEQVAKAVDIRSSRGKDVSIVAMVGGDAIGGVLSQVYNDDFGDGNVIPVYDFDVVVHPQWQGYQKVGLKLIDAALRDAVENQVQAVSVFVVNHRLAKVLMDRYGFDGDDSNTNPQVLHKYL